MMPDAIEVTFARLPILLDDWRKHAPRLCDGVDADYVLVDPGPQVGQPRYTIIGQADQIGTLHHCSDLAELHRAENRGGLGIQSSLFVPLLRDGERHRGHIAALYRCAHAFTERDVQILRSVALRFLHFLSGH